MKRELDKLTTAIISTGPLPTLLDAIKDQERQRKTLTRELAGLQAAGHQIDWTKVERDLRAKLADWQGLLQRNVPQARQILKRLLAGPIQFSPVREAGERDHTFRAPIALDRLMTGTVGCATTVASPTGVAPFMRGSVRSMRASGPIEPAFFELFLHELLLRLGFTATVIPRLVRSPYWSGWSDYVPRSQAAPQRTDQLDDHPPQHECQQEDFGYRGKSLWPSCATGNGQGIDREHRDEFSERAQPVQRCWQHRRPDGRELRRQSRDDGCPHGRRDVPSQRASSHLCSHKRRLARRAGKAPRPRRRPLT